eukprot:2511641-Rhodomonas_salina.2
MSPACRARVIRCDEAWIVDREVRDKLNQHDTGARDQRKRVQLTREGATQDLRPVGASDVRAVKDEQDVPQLLRRQLVEGQPQI